MREKGYEKGKYMRAQNVDICAQNMDICAWKVNGSELKGDEGREERKRKKRAQQEITKKSKRITRKNPENRKK
jgi:hypothetical protein